MRDSLKKYVTDALHGFWIRLKETGLPHSEISDKTASIPFGSIDLNSTSTVLTATASGITELEDGVCCYLNNAAIDSASGWTLNVNGLGAKPVYCTLEGTSRTQTAFAKGYTMLFVYNSSRVSGGCWDMYYGGNGNVPVLEQIYENYTCQAANESYAHIFFMKVYPTSDNWYTPWYVHYTLEITTDANACQGFYDINIGSSGNTSQWCVFNKFSSSSYLPTYYHLMAWYNNADKYANRETYPIRLGERIRSAYQSNTRARTYKIKVYDYAGCRIEFPSEIEPQVSFYNADYYGNYTGLDGTKVGVLDNYDANTIPYQYYEYYSNYKLHDASTPLYRYKICGFDRDNRLVPLTITDRVNVTQNVILPTQVPMSVGNGMIFYNTTTNITSGTGRTAAGGTVFRGYSQGAAPFQYNFNGLPPRAKTIYACGSYDSIRGEFSLDTSTTTSWYVYVPDNIEKESDLSQYFTEGMYYWMIGVIINGDDSQGSFYFHHPVYYFNGKVLVPADSLSGMNVVSKWNNQIFTERSTYGKNSKKATIEKVFGLSLSWNQLAVEYTVTNGTATTDDGIVEVVPNSADCRYILRTVSGSNNTTPVNTHLYLQTAIIKSDAPVAFINQNGGMVGNTPTFDFQVGDDFKRCYDIFRATSATASVLQMYSPTGDVFYVKGGSFMLFDLTIMFGAGHEPDGQEFFNLFPSESYDYCEGTLIDSFPEPELITTYDSDGNEIWNIEVGAETALRSAAFDYDEISGTTKITRIGRVNLGDLNWVLDDSTRKRFRCVGFSTTYDADKEKGSEKYTTMLCGGGYYQRIIDNTVNNLLLKEFFLGSSSGDLYIRDTRYTNATDFKNSLDGVYLNFPLTTPVETTIEDIGKPYYFCSLDGTEKAMSAYYGVTQSTPTCTPFRCCMSYMSEGEMETLVLSSDTGTLSPEQTELAFSDHCIIVFDGEYYYKNYVEGAALEYILNYIDYTDNGICQKVISINANNYSYHVEEHSLDIQSDWNENDSTSVAYIKNKPTIPTVPVQDVTVGGASVVNNGTAVIPQEIFFATYGTTTATEIAAAISNGKVIVVKEGDALYTYSTKDSNYYYFYRIAGDVLTSIRVKISDSSYGKSVNGSAVQFVNRLVTSFQVTPDDIHYPSEKLVYDSLGDKADKVSGATSGNFAGLDSNGNLTDSGSKASDFLTSHQDISGKADKILYVSAATPPASLDPNKVYQFGTLSGNTTFPAFSAVAAGDTEVKIWCWTFTTPSNAPTITWPAGITAWNGGSAPTIIGSKNYEVNVMDGVACILETDIPT